MDGSDGSGDGGTASSGADPDKWKDMFLDVERIIDYGLPQSIVEIFRNEGISKLNPPQRMALEAGLTSGKNMVVACPTASGKTVIAELAMLNTVLNLKKKAVYIVPLKALGSEKYNEFKEKYERIGLKVALSMGGPDSKETWLAGQDIIIVTAEKLDSLIRHGIDWVTDIGLVVCDEIHLLNDVSRGPTLEVTITRMRDLANFQILGLSATISNSDELAKWLSAELVKTDYRPVELERGVYHDNKITFKDYSVPVNPKADTILALVEHILCAGKQALVFVNSRPSAESQAEKIATVTKNFTGEHKELAGKIEGALSHPTRQCRRLARAVEKGSAFHHAGLEPKQRELVEENFKKGNIRVICATPTLAAGVNLPASYVIIRDLVRYVGGYGMRPIPVLEFQQMAGRAGRPRYDTKGVALAVAKSEYEIERIFDDYIDAESEKIFSKLALETVLRTHILSLIATGHVYTDEQLMKFLEKTFYAFQYNDMRELEGNVQKIIGLLSSHKMIEIEEEGNISSPSLFQSADSYFAKKKMRATALGRRVAELYIDPETAWLFVNALMKASQKNVADIALLQLVCATLEMRPALSIKKNDYEWLYEEYEKNEGKLILPDFARKYEDEAISAFKTAFALLEWCEERDEEYLFEKMGLTPGELRVKITNADWLLYSLSEVAAVGGMKMISVPIEKIRARLKYGVKEELLGLVKIRGIGRVKARALFRLGVRRLDDVREVRMPLLVKAVGQKAAISLKKKVGEDVKEEQGQKTLF